jgi:putative DNA primase/helicase
MTIATAAGIDFADVDDDTAVRLAIAAAPPIAQLPPGYALRSDGLFFDDGGDAGPFRIAGSIEVLAQTRDDLGSCWGLLLSWRDDDGREHRYAMPRSLLAGDGAEIRATLLDRGCYVAPGSKARNRVLEFLATVSTTARARAVERVGWTDGAFALPDRTIGDTDQHRVIYQGPAAFDHSYRSAGDLRAWQKGIGRYGVGNSRLAVAISAALVGPLLDLLGEEGGGINLRGPSSIGKSTALVAAASVWGPPSFVRQWRATANGLEGTAVQHNETLLCLDELAQLDPREAGSVAYMLANGMGKARAARSGALRAPSQWRVMFLSSGEIGLGELAGRDARGARRSAAGQEVRILDIEADAQSGLGLFETLHDAPNAEILARMIKDGAGLAYGVAGPAFVDAVASNRAAVAMALKSGISGFTKSNVPAQANGQVARAARRFGLIAVAGEMGVRVGVLPWPTGEASRAAAVLFERWLEGRGGTGAAEDREAVAKVRAFLEAHGSSRFEPLERSNDDFDLRIINRAGFWQNVGALREHLILPEVWRNEVCAGMDASRVARVLAERGMLQASGGKNSISRNLPGLGKSRVYIVSASIFGGDDA